MHTAHHTTERAGPWAWAGLAAMSLPIFMLATDMTVLFLALPSLSADLAPTGAQQLWILHIGEFLSAASVITFGLLTNRLGRRRLLLAAVLVYGAASLLAAFAATAEILILARALLGIAGAAFTPAGLALLRMMFRSTREFSIAFAVFMAAFTGGAAAGPPLGGLLLEHFWWGSVFLVNVPAALVLLLAGPVLLPRDRPDRSVRVDLVSVALSVAMVMALVHGLQETADSGFAPLPALSTLTGAVLVLFFLRRQARSAHPLVPLSLFTPKVFRVLVVVLFVASLGMGATDMFVTQLLQVVVGMSALQVGLLMLGPAAAGILGTLLTPLVQRLVSPAPALAGTLVLMGLSSLAAVAPLGVHDPIGLVAAITVMTASGSVFMTTASQLLITSAPEEHTGSATAVQDVFAGLGNAAGMAFMGSLGIAVYRTVLEAGAPAGLDPADAQSAQGSVGAAAAVAERLGGDAGQALMEAVRPAFTLATQTTFVAAGLVGAALAVVVALRLRGTQYTH